MIKLRNIAVGVLMLVSITAIAQPVLSGRPVPKPQPVHAPAEYGRVAPQPMQTGRHYPHEVYRGGFIRYRFKQGDRLPRELRSHSFVVEDWRLHRLPPPRRGHQWVQVNGSDYVLAAVATGVIVSVVLSGSY